MRHVLIALTLLVVAATAVAVIDWRVGEYVSGPTHPPSDTRLPPVDKVQWVWAGGVTDSSAVVRARLTRRASVAHLVLSRSPEFATAEHRVERGSIDGATRIASFKIDGLAPDTKYWYGIEVDGALDDSRRGSFRTFPASGSTSPPASFTFAFGSCIRTGSNGSVFDRIREDDPLFFLVTGDLHYEDITENNTVRFLDAYKRQLTADAQQALYLQTPVVYVWDDHDYGANNSDSTSSSREAAGAAYRVAVPHYPLSAGDGAAAIYQSFSVGRVRFIMTDVRSERVPGRTMLGPDQLEWLKTQLLTGRAWPLVIWVNPVPWISSRDDDTWAGFQEERRELADFIASHNIRNLLMLSGDAHMLAIDDGSNSDYSTRRQAGFPVFHAAALDRRGRSKGGPYSEGAISGGGQYGLVRVMDTDSGLEVSLSGRNWKGEELLHFDFSPESPIH